MIGDGGSETHQLSPVRLVGLPNSETELPNCVRSNGLDNGGMVYHLALTSGDMKFKDDGVLGIGDEGNAT